MRETEDKKDDGSLRGLVVRGPPLILVLVVVLMIGLGVGIGIGFAIGDNNTSSTTTSGSNGSGSSTGSRRIPGNHSSEITDTTVSCDVSKVNLSHFEVWRREEGYCFSY